MEATVNPITMPSTVRAHLRRWLLLLVLALLGASARAQADPPGRVGAFSHLEGSVAFAPAGETQWADASVNRPVTRGDRVWTDPGARAEVHVGTAALHLASQTFMEVVALDEQALWVTLHEGAINVRVRQLDGDNLEITTPQLVMRALQPGDYRIDVDPVNGTTRVAIRSGVAAVHGPGSGAVQLQAGREMAFAGRDLAQVAWHPRRDDGFQAWATGRNLLEDRSLSARYLTREVVGYHQLDAYGTWNPNGPYGAVWFPHAVPADWAPYRYGRWDWIPPWGWTWIDDAPWGFAPFHYGRWTQIGPRWAWVPGPLGRRPVYSPALVMFVGGQGGAGSWNLSAGSGLGVAWFPLAPGEAWRPTSRASVTHVRNINRHLPTLAAGGLYVHQSRPNAITVVRAEDFNSERPVQHHWNRSHAIDLSRTQILGQPVLPAPQRHVAGSRGESALRNQLPRQPPTQDRFQWQQQGHQQQQPQQWPQPAPPWQRREGQRFQEPQWRGR
jgi:hypothetical protein